jgi:hypothetical protein
MTDGLEVAKVTVTKTLTPDDVVVDIDLSDDLAIIDAVGMLAMAQHTLLDDRGDDEDEA